MRIIFKRLGSGGSKTIYGMGHSLVIANGINPHRWSEIVTKEVTASRELQSLGLNGLELMVIHPNTASPLLLMNNFEFLAQNGIQIIDRKNHTSSCMDTLLFKTEDNIRNARWLKSLLEDTVQDIAILITNRIDLGYDSINLCIKNRTINSDALVTTPQLEEANTSTLHRDKFMQNYELRLFLFDLDGMEKYKCRLMDSDKNIDQKRIILEARQYIEMVYDVIENHLKKQELSEISTDDGCSYLISILKNNFEEIKDELIRLVINQVIINLSNESLDFDGRKNNFPLKLRDTTALIPSTVWNNFPKDVLKDMTVDFSSGRPVEICPTDEHRESLDAQQDSSNNHTLPESVNFEYIWILLCIIAHFFKETLQSTDSVVNVRSQSSVRGGIFDTQTPSDIGEMTSTDVYSQGMKFGYVY